MLQCSLAASLDPCAGSIAMLAHMIVCKRVCCSCEALVSPVANAAAWPSAPHLHGWPNLASFLWPSLASLAWPSLVSLLWPGLASLLTRPRPSLLACCLTGTTTQQRWGGPRGLPPRARASPATGLPSRMTRGPASTPPAAPQVCNSHQ